MRRVQLILFRESLPIKVSTPESRKHILMLSDEVLKRFYLPAIVEMLNTPSFFMEMIRREEQKERIKLWSQKSVLKAMWECMKGGKK